MIKRKNALRSGKMNRKILIQQLTTETNPEGIPTETWTTAMTLYAFRVPMARFGEFFAAAAQNAEKTFRYEVRFRPGIAEDMRVLDLKDNRVYEITAALDDAFGDRTETHIIAKEITDG